MITVEPRHAARPHEALEFSQWHERCIEHLLTQSGLDVQREPEILGKTPDLLATTPDGQQVIIECIARLQDPVHAMELTETGWHCCDGKITGKLYNTMWTTPDVPAALFELYPHLSGLIYSRWPREHYYLPNPYAINPLQPDPFRFAQVRPLPARYRQPSWRPRPATMADDYAHTRHMRIRLPKARNRKPELGRVLEHGVMAALLLHEFNESRRAA